MEQTITKICTKCGEEKELSEFHKDSRIESGYRSYCKVCASVQCKEYRNNHKEEITKRKELWRGNNKKEITRYYTKNKERILKIIKEWQKNNLEKILEIRKKANTKRRRELGYNPLNEKFPGSVGHHINKNDVVYIPEELHKSIPHRQEDEESMKEINQLAQEHI